jgi:hypothetical protein
MNARGLMLTLLFLGLSGFAKSQGAGANPSAAPPPADLAKYVQHLMEMQVAFMNPPPPGISIMAKEIARQGTSGQGLVVKYHVFIKGLPPDVILTESSVAVEAQQMTPVMQGISVGKDGILMCAGKTPTQCGNAAKPDDPIEIAMQPAKGEPYRLIFFAGETRVGLMIVPDPVEARSNECALNAVRLSRNFQLAFISGEGFPPNTDIHYRFVSQSAREALAHTDAKGMIHTAMLAAGNGKQSGQASFEVLEKNCSPKVSYEWGNP